MVEAAGRRLAEESSESFKASTKSTPGNKDANSGDTCRHRVRGGRTAPADCSDSATDNILASGHQASGTSIATGSCTEGAKVEGADVEDSRAGCANSSEGVCGKDDRVGRPEQYIDGCGNGSGDSARCTKVLLVGHSLGGSIAVRVAEAAAEVK